MIINKLRVLSALPLLFLLIIAGCGAGSHVSPVADGRAGGGDTVTRPVAGGVPVDLARERAAVVYDVQYHVMINIIRGGGVDCITRLMFDLREITGPLVLDFAGESVESVKDIRGNVPFVFSDEHITIPASRLRLRLNGFEIRCRSSEAPLHRENDHLYSLFVPARAREVFPCFDQPDIKAPFYLTIRMPAGWSAVSNTPVFNHPAGWSAVLDTLGEDRGAPTPGDDLQGDSHKLDFARTKPLSTYHFAFAAGEFRVETAERGGRTMNLYHMESDSGKVARNVDAIFDLHAEALRWLEEYTGIDYPFGKFDFVALPSFPYSGMEHPGCIFYRASRLFLEESATEKERLRRASLISHETAHMWFGDLVTMTWFDDVWLKEAFAQFMADRIIQPAFPGIDHRLLFAASHYDNLYDVERTAGTNPIRQELDNLNEAGSLYGNIIYHKPPVMLNQLEALMGEDRLRDGLREYLEAYRFGNATWEDLVTILDARTDRDLRAWSTAWVMERGRPDMSIERIRDGGGVCRELRVTQHDPLGRGLLWPQRFMILIVNDSAERLVECRLSDAVARVKLDEPVTKNDFLLPCAAGAGFGYFALDTESMRLLRERPPRFEEPLHRGMYELILHDNVLEGNIGDIDQYLDILCAMLEHETVETNLQSILNHLGETFWLFLSDSTRVERAGPIERLLVDKIVASPEPSMKSACFKTLRAVATTEEGVRYLHEVWKGEREIEGLELSERDHAELACALAVRGVSDWREVLDGQEKRIKDEMLQKRFRFVRRAASADRAERDAFFAGLSDMENRRHEPWVLEALSYLHHPLRGTGAEEYILPSLELLDEIRATGDIFFPRDWTKTTLRYHHSGEAVRVVRGFLAARPNYPKRLRGVILQAVDLPMRANNIHSGGR